MLYRLWRNLMVEALEKYISHRSMLSSRLSAIFCAASWRDYLVLPSDSRSLGCTVSWRFSFYALQVSGWSSIGSALEQVSSKLCKENDHRRWFLHRNIERCSAADWGRSCVLSFWRTVLKKARIAFSVIWWSFRLNVNTIDVGLMLKYNHGLFNKNCDRCMTMWRLTPSDRNSTASFATDELASSFEACPTTSNCSVTFEPVHFWNECGGFEQAAEEPLARLSPHYVCDNLLVYFLTGYW